MRDESLLLSVLGNSPEMRIIDFFLDNKLFDFSKKEIMKETRMSKVTFYKVWKDIEKAKLVKIKRSFGKTKLYELNKKSQIVQCLTKIEDMLIEMEIEKKGKRIAVPVRR